MNKKLFSTMYNMLLDEYFKMLRSNKVYLKGANGHRSLNPEIIPAAFRRKLRVLYDLTDRRKGELNVFSEEGTKVTYDENHNNSMFVEDKDNAKRYLRHGWTYTIKTCIPFDSFTVLELQEFPGVVFSSVLFTQTEGSFMKTRDVIREYGPDFEHDKDKALEIIKEYMKNKLTPVEELTELYDHLKEHGGGPVSILDSVSGYINKKMQGPPMFSIGCKFDDGSRTISILNISDIPGDEGLWCYFCKKVEHDDGSISYSAYNQKEMYAIWVGDINRKKSELTRKEQLIHDILILNGGATGAFHKKIFKPDRHLNIATTPELSVGQVLVNSRGRRTEILDCSPCQDSDGYWEYFYRTEYINARGKKRISFFCMPYLLIKEFIA